MGQQILAYADDQGQVIEKNHSILAVADAEGRVTPSTAIQAARSRVFHPANGFGHVLAFADAAGHVYAEWDEGKHPRQPAGSDKGGEFAPASVVVGPEAIRGIASEHPNWFNKRGFLYHGTLGVLLPGIVKSGLVPGIDSDVLWASNRALSTSREVESGAIIGDSGSVLIRVPKSKFEMVPFDKEERDLGDREFFTSSRILPKEIDVLTVNGWSRLDKWSPALGYTQFNAYSDHTISRPLYVSRHVENADEIITWAKSVGFETTLPAEDMHVTICYSKEPVDWLTLEHWADTLEVPPEGVRTLEFNPNQERDWHGRWVDVYHGTATDYVQSIAKNGLAVQKDKRINSESLYKGERGRSVFVTDKKELAESYAITMARSLSRGKPPEERGLRLMYSDVYKDKSGKPLSYEVENFTGAVLHFRVPRGVADTFKQDRHEISAYRTHSLDAKYLVGYTAVTWDGEKGDVRKIEHTIKKHSVTETDLYVTVFFLLSKASYADRTITTLGEDGAVVLQFESMPLQARHQYFLDHGASWDYDAYHPHITLTYKKPERLDLSTVEPYTGKIVLGLEQFAELETGWAEDIKENAEEDGVWRTVRGRRVFIRDGEDLDSALKRSLQGTGAELTDSDLADLEPRWSKIKDAKLRLKLNDAVDNYSNSESYQEINDALRKKDAYAWTTGPQQREIRALDEAFRVVGTPLLRDTMLYRVVGKIPVQLKVGSVFQDLGFTSTTASTKFADDIQEEIKGVKLLIRAEAGSRVLSPIGKRGVKEVILPRGGSYKVTRKISDKEFEVKYAVRQV